ncbi:MAG TPA: hypothetical protein VFA06_13720 [Actinocrinis sp.]|uniref:hypothetical protein n=1 Tax=Actinocrinis sp. TaxID=1920516 RepID=UPI002D6B8B4B|nr:hypothetical protein [Actinocrinis sp.]HZU56925.1 hypothetical protein [Actinocrinis sp.]
MSEPWGQQPQQSGGDWSVPQGGEESGSFAPPPVDPQYGSPQYAGQQAQPQYSAPQQPAQPFGAAGQPQYGEQPQYGQPGFGAPAGPGGYGGYVPPQQEKNGFSIAGIILCFLPLFGLIFSILGLVRSGKIGGKGRGLAIAGLVLSLVFVGGYAAIGVALSKSTQLDPGCTSAESSFRSMQSKLTADGNKLTSDGGNQATLQSDLVLLNTDLTNMKSALDNALGQAKKQEVKDKLQALDTDLTTMLNGLKALQSGDTGQLDAFQTAANRIGPEADAVDSICSF